MTAMTTPSGLKPAAGTEQSMPRRGLSPWLGLLAASWSPLTVRRRSMSFGDDPAQRVIAFLPQKAQPGPWVYFMFGGSWASGSPRLWSWAGNWFARHGIPAVLGGYRLTPDHVFPAQLDDALAGFAFCLMHARELGVAGRPAVLAGASAGGHLAALSALQLARDAANFEVGECQARVAGLLLVNSPVDLLASDPRKGDGVVESLTGHRRPWPEADPLPWVNAQSLCADAIPPTLLVQGRVDELVPPVGAEHFADAVNALAPGRAEVVSAPWREHTDLTRLFLDRDVELSERVLDWLRSVARARASSGD